MITDEFKARVSQIFQDLERYSYYELLNLPPTTTPDQVRSMFHRMALSMHPDRHYTSEDKDLRKMLYAIYKRISEGYRVLMDPAQRGEYDRLLQEGTLRLVKKEKKKEGGPQPENEVKDHDARRFFVIGLKAEREGDLAGAKLNYKFAMDMEPENAVIQERMRRVTQWMGGSKKKKKKW